MKFANQASSSIWISLTGMEILQSSVKMLLLPMIFLPFCYRFSTMTCNFLFFCFFLLFLLFCFFLLFLFSSQKSKDNTHTHKKKKKKKTKIKISKDRPKAKPLWDKIYLQESTLHDWLHSKMIKEKLASVPHRFF